MFDAVGGLPGLAGDTVLVETSGFERRLECRLGLGVVEYEGGAC